ncbi:Vesicle-fusing ATPase [Camellia lanceoleosa]|uniref:Vesicle-fusing ATPase n=1 Tax=Camellia lanceoleosa TaxID=1840588 RepID=A0ACC0HN40_9ERIC|nr:Vesicle-fusing ATPase [Camellia lanceoleosa]
MRQAFVLDKDVNLQEIACKTDGCSGAAIASLVTCAHSYAVVQVGERGLVKHVRKDVKVTMNHFLHAIEDIKSRVHKSGLEPHRPVKADELMVEYPGHFICDSTHFKVGHHILGLSANEELERRCRRLYFPSSHGNALLSPSGDCDGERCCRASGGEVFQTKIFDSCFGDEFEGGGNGRFEKRKERSNEM